MKKLSIEQVIKLHTHIVELTGGTDGVREIGLLESAVEMPFQSCFGEDVYPTIQEKGTRLGYGLIKNHCMLDGNKRIGVHSMLVFFDLNGVVLSYTQKELFEMVLDVAAGNMAYEDMLEWVSKHQVA